MSFKELVSSLSTFLRGSPEEVAEIQFKTVSYFMFLNTTMLWHMNHQWDADNNGKLDREEFSALLKSINRSSLTSDDVEALGITSFFLYRALIVCRWKFVCWAGYRLQWYFNTLLPSRDYPQKTNNGIGTISLEEFKQGILKSRFLVPSQSFKKIAYVYRLL